MSARARRKSGGCVSTMPKFVAPDGAEFEDRNEYRTYVFEKFYTFKELEGKKLSKYPGDIAGQPFNLTNLRGCEVLLLDHCAQVQIDELNNCHVFVGPCEDSVFIRDCANCVFTIAAQQLRFRNCTQCDVFLYSQSDPVIEYSSGISFASFNGAYPKLGEHFTKARLDPTKNHWRNVFDFNEGNPEYPEPHWLIMDEEKASQTWEVNFADEAEGGEPAENPVPRDAECPPPAKAHAGAANVMSFPIGTSQAEAESAVAAAAAPESKVESDEGESAATAAEPEVVDKRIAWREAYNARNRDKEAAENDAKEARRAKAEEEKEEFYEARTNRLAQKGAHSRSEEEAKIAAIDAEIEAAATNPWARVVSLVDLSADESQKTDLSRFREVLLRLKAEPLKPASR